MNSQILNAVDPEGMKLQSADPHEFSRIGLPTFRQISLNLLLSVRPASIVKREAGLDLDTPLSHVMALTPFIQH